MSRRGWEVTLIVLGFAVLSMGAAWATVLRLATGPLITLAGSWLVWRQFPGAERSRDLNTPCRRTVRPVVITEGLTHIHLIVRNLDRSLRFYQRVFGLEERFRDGPNMIFLGTPGRADTITLNEDPEAQDRAGDNGGIAHFGFRLLDKSDLDAAIAEVEEAGGHLVRRGEHEPDHPFAYVTDPDGYVIEL